jgi:predicted transcriptional regulator
MAKKTKIREIRISNEGGAFASFFRKFSGEHDSFDFEGLSTLRMLLSNEKAKILHIIKTRNPSSIYELSKMSGRDFKAVSDDIKVLERFGLLDMISEKTGKRERLRPVITTDELIVKFQI